MADLPIRRSHACGALFAAWTLFFLAPLTSSGVPYLRDMLVTAMPLRQYINGRLRQGQLPQWYPYESLGVPLIGQIATTLFHPATLWMLPLSPGVGLKVTLLLAYLAGLCGAYRFTRALDASRLGALTGAFAYGFGGYALGVSSIVHYVIAVGTVPWLAVWGLRLFKEARPRDCAIVALAWASLFLAGDAQTYLLSAGLLAGLFALYPSRRGAVLGIVAGVASVLLCGIEYLPARVLAAESVRGTGTPTDLLNQVWALTPQRMWEFFIPGFIPEPPRAREAVLQGVSNTLSFFCTTLFVGGTVLTFALAGLRSPTRKGKRLCMVMAALGLWLSLGQWGHLLPLLQSVVPLLARFRYPEKYLMWMWLAGAPLVAWGVEHVRHNPRPWIWGLTGASAAVLAAAVQISSLGGTERIWRAMSPAPASDDLLAAIEAAWGHGLLCTGVMLLLLALMATVLRTRPNLAWLLPVAVFVELWQANAGHLPLVQPAVIFDTPPFVAAMRATQQPNTPLPRLQRERVPFYGTRITTAEPEEVQQWMQSEQDMLPPDVGGLYGVTTLGMNLGGESVRHHKVLSTYGKLSSRYGSDFNACFNVTALDRDLTGEEKELVRDEAVGMKLLTHSCRPRAFLSGTQQADTMSAAAKMMESQGADHVVWEQGPNTDVAHGQVTWVQDDPEHWVLDVRADGPTALIVSNALGPGWSAQLDDAAVPIYPAMVAAGGIAMPAGAHRVVFHYETPMLLAGAWMTGLGLAVVALLFTLGWPARV